MTHKRHRASRYPIASSVPAITVITPAASVYYEP